MKKLLSKLGILAVIVSILPFSAFAEPTNDVRDLLAGKDNKVGTVETWNDYENIYVKYKLSEEVIEEGWCLTETHLHLAGDLKDLPSAGGKNKNLVPGQFKYKEDHALLECFNEYEYTIPLGDMEPGYEAILSAHAKIEKETCEDTSQTIMSDEDTMIGENNSVPTWVHPNWTTIEGAEWIWNSEEVERPRDGETVEFTRNFDVLGDVFSATIRIASDNTFYAEMNEEFVGESIDLNNFNAPKEYDVADKLVIGGNTLFVEVENIPWNTDDSHVNPGGLIYSLDIESEYCTVESESAWADGKNFNDKGNWATYFTYVIQAPENKLISAVYDGMCKTFGSHVGDKMKLTFEYNIYDSDNIFVYFDNSQEFREEYGKASYIVSGKELVITVTQRWSNPRPELDYLITGISGLVDDFDNPVIAQDVPITAGHLDGVGVLNPATSATDFNDNGDGTGKLTTTLIDMCGDPIEPEDFPIIPDTSSYATPSTNYQNYFRANAESNHDDYFYYIGASHFPASEGFSTANHVGAGVYEHTITKPCGYSDTWEVGIGPWLYEHDVYNLGSVDIEVAKHISCYIDELPDWISSRVASGEFDEYDSYENLVLADDAWCAPGCNVPSDDPGYQGREGIVFYKKESTTFEGIVVLSNTVTPPTPQPLQIKLEGLGSMSTDSESNEWIGYIGRWWDNNTNANINDTQYESVKSTHDVLGYTVFDGFDTSQTEKEFSLDYSYHTLPLAERGDVAMTPGDYRVNFALTENESLWRGVFLSENPLEFTIVE